jgi:hypothetical protein
MFMNEHKDMTDEEYDALDEELTRTIPKLGPNGSGWLSQREMYRLGFSNMTVNYLLTKATADHKTPAQLVNELVYEKIAVSM